MKFCPNCGNKVKPEDNVCSNCGYRLKKEPVKTAQQSQSSVSQNPQPQFPTRTSQQNEESPKKKHIAYKVFITLGILAVIGEGGYIAYQHLNQSSISQVTTQSSNSTSTASSAQSSQASINNGSSSSTQDSQNNSGGLWNSEKEEKFESFFDSWADTMDQQYTKYTGGEMKTASGSEFPEDFDNFYVDNEKVSIGLSKNGEGNNDYNVVAMYNYNKPGHPGTMHITYFFAFHNGSPVVLVDQSTNGNISATVTENKKLRDGFAQIASE